MSSSALIGDQHNTGNLWLGTFGEHARYDLPPNTNPDDKFWVDTYSGDLLPNNRYPSGTNWFKPEILNLPYYLCSYSNPYCSGNGGGMEFTNMDENILQENLGGQQYTEEVQREAEAYLYEKVKDNPILQMQNVDVEAFYEDKSETNIGAFSEVKDGVRNLYLSPQVM